MTCFFLFCRKSHGGALVLTWQTEPWQQRSMKVESKHNFICFISLSFTLQLLLSLCCFFFSFFRKVSSCQVSQKKTFSAQFHQEESGGEVAVWTDQSELLGTWRSRAAVKTETAENSSLYYFTNSSFLMSDQLQSLCFSQSDAEAQKHVFFFCHVKKNATDAVFTPAETWTWIFIFIFLIFISV